MVKQLQKHDSWYTVVDEILEEIIKLKFKHCNIFQSKLKLTTTKQLIYVHRDRYLGSGLTYQLTSLTKAKYFPGHNKLGELLVTVRNSLL